MGWVQGDADSRQEAIEDVLRNAFSNFIEKREVDVIVFSSMTAFDLANAIVNHPLILKSLLAACNIAARAVERDLSIKNLDTYNPRLSEDQIKVIAGYIKPFLPSYLEIPTLSRIDRVAFIDKEIRKVKGRWEKKILESLNRFGMLQFRKRMFVAEGEQFELDAASPESGGVKVGIDIKRIEARRDIHKRCDEIVNKADKVKSSFPGSKFGVVVYYPFIEEHINIQNRLRSDNIDGIVFASETKESIEHAVRLLLSTLGVSKK
ncbi:TPA: hypothetical protein EYP66_05095 [Candidatus Poribacteria bacterium]|nr:hypothetical protein [Candidatus Poribacteria bacterium]